MINDFTICVDFDATLVDHRHDYTLTPNPYALEYLHRFNDLGARLILYTVRDGKMLEEAHNYLIKNSVKLFGVNDNPEQHEWNNSRKVHADLFIDDRAFGCPLIKFKHFQSWVVNWKIVEPKVLRVLNENTKNTHI